MTRQWLQLESRRLPIVNVRLGVNRCLALIDTGAEVSMVAPHISLRLGLSQIGDQMIVGVTGHSELFRVVQLSSVGLGSIDLDPFRAVVCEVSRIGFPIDLILGVNAFKNHRIQFDFIDERIYIIQ
jgi:predicted aspartyl protease